jgi:hypothetical protein
MAKYIITVARLDYGEITVEANDREEAKKKALDRHDEVKWFDDPAFRIAEVERIERGI